jgi:hypothetical protein
MNNFHYMLDIDASQTCVLRWLDATRWVNSGNIDVLRDSLLDVNNIESQYPIAYFEDDGDQLGDSYIEEVLNMIDYGLIDDPSSQDPPWADWRDSLSRLSTLIAIGNITRIVPDETVEQIFAALQAQEGNQGGNQEGAPAQVEWEQAPPLPTEVDWEQRKKEQLEQQDSDGGRAYVGKVPLAKRQEYYKTMFGEDYLERKVFNAIMYEEVTIQDYIEEDDDNLVFVIQGQVPEVLFTSSRSLIASHMAVYDCDQEGKKYLAMNLVGLVGLGMMNYDAVKVAVLNSNYQIIALQGEGTTGKLESHEIRHYGETVVGGWHCQDGSEKPYYKVHVPG